MKAEHVILGTGPIGLATATALVERGETVRMVNRSGHAPSPGGVEVVGGDATDPAFTTAVADGARVVYQTLNPPSHLVPLVDRVRVNPECATGGQREWSGTIGPEADIHRCGFAGDRHRSGELCKRCSRCARSGGYGRPPGRGGGRTSTRPGCAPPTSSPARTANRRDSGPSRTGTSG